MVEESYPSGPDLSEHFPKRKDTDNIPLPAQFDDRCHRCKRPMERVRVSLQTETRPYAQFHCTPCSVELYIFEAPRKPFLIWSGDFRGIVKVSEFIADKIKEREQEHTRDLAREQSAV